MTRVRKGGGWGGWVPRATGRLATLLAALLAWGVAGAVPDAGLLDTVLLHNVRNGYVDYDGIAADPRFAAFLEQLAAPDGPPAGREASLAHHINAYNAFAISGVLGGHTPATRLGRRAFFRGLEFALDGGTVSLRDLEQQRLVPLADPRVHFALACAALACPRLSNHAYLPETVDAQLEEAAKRFVNDITRNRFDVAQKTAFVSPLFAWHRREFEQAAGSVAAYLARYVEDPATRAALREGRLELAYLPEDWDLNGRHGAAEAP